MNINNHHKIRCIKHINDSNYNLITIAIPDGIVLQHYLLFNAYSQKY